ncbi:MAG: phenylacetate-CoA oxygenase subunit PaaJ [Comamonadaceae bacterium]|nr:MAG: phenylacetate-CoA oxygenase subunit PaaJ [Comamonadaceae bacterium]
MVAVDTARAWALLESVPDPEIPVVSIRELGILRGIEEVDGELHVIITPTYSGCPAMGQIEDDIQSALASGGLEARIVTRLAPAWTTDWMTDTAKGKLRAYGIAPPHTAVADTVIRFALRSGASALAIDAVACPHCGSANTTETSHFSSTACKSLHKCLDCLEPFDHFKPY